MAITAGQKGRASDFVDVSAGAADAGKVPKLNSIGKQDYTLIDRVISPVAGEDINGSTTPVPAFIAAADLADKIVDTAGDATDVELKGGTNTWYGVGFKKTSVPLKYVNRVTIRIKKTGTPGNLSVKLYADNGSGLPGTLIASIGTITAADVTGSYTDVSVTAATSYPLQATTHVVFDKSSGTLDGSNYYTIRYDVGGSGATILRDNDGTGVDAEEENAVTPYLELTMAYVGGNVYRSDANDSPGRQAFHGFVLSNTAAGANVNFQTDGVLVMSGLTKGAYYVSDTIGTISPTAGSLSIEVGRAYTTGLLLIKRT